MKFDMEDLTHEDQLQPSNLWYLESETDVEHFTGFKGPSLYPYTQNADGVPTGPLKRFPTHDKYINHRGLKYDSVETREVDTCLKAYVNYVRQVGAIYANLDPLGFATPRPSTFEPERFGLTDLSIKSDLTDPMCAGKTVGQVIEDVRRKYLGTMSSEFMHSYNETKRDWFFENYERQETLSKDDQICILQHLTEAEGFEGYLHGKFPGAKRFSVEGAESALVIFEAFLSSFASEGGQEVVLGMAHRGRLNFLTKTLGCPYSFVINMFRGYNAFDPNLGISGDVKYHLGYSSDRKVGDKTVHLSLQPNPSHLESVNPVVLGNARGKQDDRGKSGHPDFKAVCPFLIHGDASMAGQGIVYENMNMGALPGYTNQGTVHLIIDNQVGFTAEHRQTRSTVYASDIAKMIGAPIIHVNGDDPESAHFAGKLAGLCRQIIGGDVVINLTCYRRYGHNEGDEPNFTQPKMYSVVKQHPATRKIYADKLARAGILAADQSDKMVADFQAHLEAESAPEKFKSWTAHNLLIGKWQGIHQTFELEESLYDTSIDASSVTRTADLIKNLQPDSSPHPKIKKLMEQRVEMLESGHDIDWGCGEMLAFASLLIEGKNIRISGQDVIRGTFSHRHTAIVNQKTGEYNFYLRALCTTNRFEVYSSLLSEYAVLGFEYGYASRRPDDLVIWEAQFGDFANGAQIIMDQYLSSSEQKWLRMNNMVLMLPHGYEGQGPEHSSARIERFLQLAGQYNMRIVNLTNPANLFHALRLQVLSPVKKPLIIFTPKSLLRHKMAVSNLSDFTESKFQPLLFTAQNDIQKAKKLILCSGKIYYEILFAMQERKIEGIELVRIERLYPFPEKELVELLENFASEIPIYWAQEEPRNMGAWLYINETLNSESRIIKYIGRLVNASPSTGHADTHRQEVEAIIEECLAK